MGKKEALSDFLRYFNKSQLEDLPANVAGLVKQGDYSEAAREMVEQLRRAQEQSRVRSMADLGPRRPPSPDSKPRKYYPQGTGMIVRDKPHSGMLQLATTKGPQSKKASGAAKTPAPKEGSGDAGKQAAFIDRLLARVATLSPASMDVDRTSKWLPKELAVDDTAGDAVRKILGYGVLPGAGVGRLVGQAAESYGHGNGEEASPVVKPVGEREMTELRESLLRQLRAASQRGK